MTMMKPHAKLLATLLTVVLALSLLPMAAGAATILVTVATGDGSGSLPAALASATDGDTIAIATGTVTTVNGSDQRYVINHNVKIQGHTDKPTLENLTLEIKAGATLSLDTLQLGNRTTISDEGALHVKDVTLLDGSLFSHKGGTSVDTLFRVIGDGDAGAGDIKFLTTDAGSAKVTLEGVKKEFRNSIFIDGSFGTIAVGSNENIATDTDVATVRGSITGGSLWKEAPGTLIVTGETITSSRVAVVENGGKLRLEGYDRSIDSVTVMAGTTMEVAGGTLTVRSLEGSGTLDAQVIMDAADRGHLDVAGNLSVTNLQLNGNNLSYVLDANNKAGLLTASVFDGGSAPNSITLNNFIEGRYVLLNVPAGTLHKENYSVGTQMNPGERAVLSVETVAGRDQLILETFSGAVDADDENNSLTVGDIVNGRFSLTAAGDRQDAANLQRGDQRYVPSGWTYGTQSGTFPAGGPYTVEVSAQMGTHDAIVTFRLEQWEAGQWEDTGEQDEKRVSLSYSPDGDEWVTVWPPGTKANPVMGR